jgi:Phosphotransferase enzyme family
VPHTIRALEERFGTLTPLGGGYSSKVYASSDRVLKVYFARNGSHLLEAEKMRRAGLGDWVLETLEVAPSELPGLNLRESAEVLVMRRFAGQPVQPQQIRAALPALGEFLRQLHAIRGAPVNLEALREKLERFDASLSTLSVRSSLEPLFTCVRQHLNAGNLSATSSLCHLDLWSSNVLFAPPNRVLVVDWHKSAFDDSVRDYALFFTGTLELLPLPEARALILELTDAEGVTARLLPYIALSTLHDLYWFHTKQPEGFTAALDLKLPRVLELLA